MWREGSAVKRSWVQLPVPTSGTSQSSVTLTPEAPASFSGLDGQCVHVTTDIHAGETVIHIREK